VGGSHPAAVLAGPVLALLALAAAWDLRTQRVPNWLTFGGSLVGLAVNVAIAHERGALTSLTGWALGIGFLLIPFLLGGIGGGDVKLLGMAGAWGGPGYAFTTLFFGAMVGGVVALILLLRSHLPGLTRALQGQHGDLPPSRSPAGVTTKTRYLTYAPALALGGLIALVVA
jgi:prepilin peptidase CpaA